MARPVEQKVALELQGIENRRTAARAWARGLIPILRELISDGRNVGLEQIALELNIAGIPARRGGKWQKTSVSRLLNIAIEQSAVSTHLETLHEIAQVYRKGGYPSADSASKLATAAQERYDAGLQEAKIIQGELWDTVGWTRTGQRRHPDLPSAAYEREVRRFVSDRKNVGFSLHLFEELDLHMLEWQRHNEPEELP